jgi:hypothetical protein
LRPTRSRTIGCLALSGALLALFSPAATFAHADATTHGTLLVAPVPTVKHPVTPTPQLSWSTGNGSPGLVTVSADGGKEALVAAGPSGSAAVPWIAAGQVYVFRLYSTTPGRTLLARLTVGKPAALEVVAPTPTPKITSPFINRVLQLLAFAAVATLFLLTAGYALSVRRDG